MASVEGDLYIRGNPDRNFVCSITRTFSEAPVARTCRELSAAAVAAFLANYVAKGTVRLAFACVGSWQTLYVSPSNGRMCRQPRPDGFLADARLALERQDQLWEADPYVMVQFATELGLDGVVFSLFGRSRDRGKGVERMDQARCIQHSFYV